MYSKITHACCSMLFVAFCISGCTKTELDPVQDCSGIEHDTIGSDVVSILDFPGITRNDMIDDAVAIQQIVDSVQPGTNIFFPAGKYIFSYPVSITTKNIDLSGEPGTVFVFDNKIDHYANYNTRIGMLNIGADDADISRITFDQFFSGSGRMDGDKPRIACVLIGTYINNDTVSRILVRNISVVDCVFRDYYGDGLSVFHSRAVNLSIRRNLFISTAVIQGWRKSVIGGSEQSINVAEGEFVLIDSNVIRGALDDAIAVHNNSSDITITNNSITTTGGRIFLAGIKRGFCAMNVITFFDSSEKSDGIWLSYEVNKDIYGRTVIGNRNDSVVVKFNTITVNGDSGTHGIRLFGPGTNIQVVNNKVSALRRNAGSFGIDILNRFAPDYKDATLNYFGDKIQVKGNIISGFGNSISYAISKPRDSMLYMQPTLLPYVAINNNTIYP